MTCTASSRPANHLVGKGDAPAIHRAYYQVPLDIRRATKTIPAAIIKKSEATRDANG